MIKPSVKRHRPTTVIAASSRRDVQEKQHPKAVAPELRLLARDPSSVAGGFPATPSAERFLQFLD
jgi:hypothetical protein